MVDDAIALGVQHAALNVDLANLFAWNPAPDAIPMLLMARGSSSTVRPSPGSTSR